MIQKGKIGLEDIETGKGNFSRTGRTGSPITLTKINTQNLPTPGTLKTSDYTATTDDYAIGCDATSGDITVTLPASSVMPIKELIIMKLDSSSNTVYVSGTINNSTYNRAIKSQYGHIRLGSGGSSWGWITLGVQGLII